MSNVDVFLKKLKLPAKYLKEPVVEIMLRKPGTLSKNEKKLLINLVNLFELRDIKPKISRNKLSADFIKSIKEEKWYNIIFIE